MDILCNSKDTDRSRNNSNHECKHYNYTAITKRSNFHSHIYSLNVKNSLLLFTIFSIVLPIGIQPQLQTTEAFDESVINDNIDDGMRDDSNGNGNGETNKNVRAFEDPASSSSQMTTQSSHEVYGDFNGDGRDDLAIGVSPEDLDSTIGEIVPNAGAVHVIYGSSSGLSATTPIRNQVWTQNSANVQDSSEAFDNFGTSLAAGDFNGDGNDDLAIGVPSESAAVIQSGAVNVIYGSSSGLSATTVPDQFWTQNSANVADSSENGDLFGETLAAGDFNGDGDDDLAIGVGSEDVVTQNDDGAVNVIYGSSSGLSATTVPDQFWTQDSANVQDSSEEDDSFGSSLAVGDFNGDGNDDLGIGVFGEDVGGAVNVIYGSLSGLSATTVPDQFWTQDSANVQDSSELSDAFGLTLAAGDFNGDGDDDLAIGVPQEGVVSLNDNAGAVNVIYGSLSGLSATTVPDQFWTQDSADVEDSSEANDEFGRTLAAGDFNGDGDDDLAIGVPGEDVVVPDDNAGAVNVIYGTLSGLSDGAQLPDKFLTQDYPNVEDSSEVGDRFGESLEAGDFNGDGNDDLAIGVSREFVGSPSVVNAGAVNVIYGGSAGVSPTQSLVFDQFFSQASPDIGLAPDSGDRFGFSLG